MVTKVASAWVAHVLRGGGAQGLVEDHSLGAGTGGGRAADPLDPVTPRGAG